MTLYREGTVLFSDGADLWTTSPIGERRRRVTFDGAAGFYGGGRWSPDGRLIAAERTPGGDGPPRLALVEPATGSSRLISPPGMWLDGYSWSPDGRMLAYAGVTAGGSLFAGGTLDPQSGEIRVYDLATETEATIGRGVHPAWSPDRRWIAYVHAAGAIAMSAADGSSAQWIASLADLNRFAGNIAPRGFRFFGTPAWSRDGMRIAFPAIEGGPILEALQVIFVGVPAPGSPLRAYPIGKTGAQHHVVNLEWSPTGDLLGLSFIYAQPHHHYIGVIDPRKSNIDYLFDSAHHFLDYTWAPDGSQMLLAIDDEPALALIGVARPNQTPPRLTFFGYRPDWCCRRTPQAR